VREIKGEGHGLSVGKALRGSKVEAVNMFSEERFELIT
jgi:hypothetical protein